MTCRSFSLSGLFFLLLALAVAGCTSNADRVPDDAGNKSADERTQAAGTGSPTDEKKEIEVATADGGKKKEEAGSKKPKVAKTADKGTGVEPFTPPTLAELDKTAGWIDQPVTDFMALLNDELKKEKMLATVADALKLRNDSKEANAKILSALGRLPENDKDVDWEATINRHSTGEVKNTNPLMMSSTVEFDVAGLTGFSMFGFGRSLRMSASDEAVTSWQSSADRLMDKVVLRDDLTWQDGKPITAHDVVFSFRTIMNPNVLVPAVRSGTDKLRWVEAYDDRTMVFFHKEALATNVENISFPIIPKHIYEESVKEDPTLGDSEYHVKLQGEPIVGGAYVISSRVQGQEMVLTRRESYYMHNGKQVRPKPYFKTVRIRFLPDTNTALLALKKGDIDEMILTPSQWTTQTGNDDFYNRNTKGTGLEWGYFYFGWNLKAPFFSDVRVRKAMSYAFNYDEMLNTLCFGLYDPCNGMFNPSSWMAPKNPPPFYKQNLSKAEELLDEAGWIDHDGDGVRDKEIGGKLKRFEFTILCSNVPDRIEICSLLKQNLDQIGVICNVRPTEFAVLQEILLKKDFEAEYGGWGSGTDPDTSDNIWKTGEPRNFVNYSNPEVDKLYEQGRKEFDREKRAAIYARIDELIYADQPYTFLYYRNSFYGFDRQLRGYLFSPRGPFHYSPGFSSIWRVLP